MSSDSAIRNFRPRFSPLPSDCIQIVAKMGMLNPAKGDAANAFREVRSKAGQIRR